MTNFLKLLLSDEHIDKTLLQPLKVIGVNTLVSIDSILES